MSDYNDSASDGPEIARIGSSARGGGGSQPEGLLGSLFGSLPPVIRELLPLPPSNVTPAAAPVQREGTSWQDVCFIHSIPGDENDQGLLVLADGTMRKYINCKGVNALLFDEAERERMSKQFVSLLDACETDIQLIIKSRSFSVDDYLSKHMIPVKTDVEYLRWYADFTDKWYRRIQAVHQIPHRDFYVVVSYQPSDCRNKTKAWNGRRTIHKHEEFVAELNNLVERAVARLEAADLRPRVISKRELRDLIYVDLNPEQALSEPQAPPSRPDISEASCLARSALKITDEYVWLDGRYIGTQYMAEPPHESISGWLVDLLKVPVEYTFSMFIHACDQESARKKMQSFAKHQNTGHNLSSKERADSARQAMEAFLSGYGKAFDVSCYIRTEAESPEILTANMDDIRKVFRRRTALLDRAQTLQLEAWQSTLAVGVDKLAFVHRMVSDEIGSFSPFFSAQCGTPDGVPFGFSLASDEPVLFNPFYRGQGKEGNNLLVVGSLGSGKSFATATLIFRLLPLGVRFTLIDKTVDRYGAYRFMTEVLGPEHCDYIDIGPSSGRVINPFDLGVEDKAGDPSPEKINALLSLLDLMLCPDGREELGQNEKALLDGLIRVAYMDCQLRGTVPTMSDLARVAGQAAADEVDPMQRERLLQFARGIGLFTRSGGFGGFIDGYTNIDSEKLLLVFDTREITDPRLDRVAFFILSEFVKQKGAELRARGVRYGAIIDEIAHFMKFKAGARALENLSRKARSSGMMLVSVTQQLNDFFLYPEHAQTIINQAETKLLLKQNPSDLRRLKEAFKLTDAEIVVLSNLSDQQEKTKDSRFLLIVGGVHGTVRLVPSGMDYWICTSEPVVDMPRRGGMIQEVKTKTPKLNHTDACRQAVYYLDLQGF